MEKINRHYFQAGVVKFIRSLIFVGFHSNFMDMLTSNSNLQSVRIILSGTSCKIQNDNLLGPVLFISATY